MAGRAFAVAPRPEVEVARYAAMMERWAQDPVAFVTGALGAEPDPWQCDVLDALVEDDSVAVRSCHGTGKTATLAWAIAWFTCSRPYPKVPTTAPTFNKQVRDVLWSEIHRWWRRTERRAPWLFRAFDLHTTRLRAREATEEWFAVGIASSKAVNMEGYHAQHLLVVFDEAKGIPRATWEAVQGMRTTQEVKMLVASTPGGPVGEFFNVFTKYRATWKSLFVVHPEALREALGRPEAVGRHPETGEPVVGRYAKGGTYYSARPRPDWVEARRSEWGQESPVFVARVVGDFPTLEGDVLIPYTWLSDAEDREVGAPGPRWVACDVARFGRDRTVVLAGEGGTLLHGETVARTPAESTAPEARSIGVGADPKQPRYRATDVTADICQRVRRQFGAEGIVVDDTGLGGSVTDILRRRGERVIPVSFGAAPTDRPRDTEAARARRARHLTDSLFVNLKAQMGLNVRAAFEVGAIALGSLRAPSPDGRLDHTRDFLDALVGQASLVKYELTPDGRYRLVDPDEDDAYELATGTVEGRRSPDHFHALLLYWWAAGGAYRSALPRGGPAAVPEGVAKVGQPSTQVGRLVGPGGAPQVAGQAAALGGRYRS